MSGTDRLIGDSFTFRTGLDGSAGDWDAFRALYRSGGEVFREADDFGADIVGTRLDRAILFDRRVRGTRHERRREHLAHTGFDHVTLHLNRRGRIDVDVGDGFRPLAEGAAVLLDGRLPMRLRLVDVHLFTASLARGLVLAVADVVHGTVIPPGRTAILRNCLNERDGITDQRPLDDPRLLMPILAMMAPDRPGERRLRRQLIQRALIRDYVEANLADRALNPAAIARACGISRPVLYRLTEPDGGVANFIRKVRLARLERLLADGDDTSLLNLAERLGFANGSHMSRQFRAVAGISPGRYRATSRGEAIGDAARRRWNAWMSEFR